MGIVIVCDSDPGFISRVSPLLVSDGLTAIEAKGASEARMLAIEHDAHALVFGPSVPADEILAYSEQLAPRDPAISIIAVVASADTHFMRRAMRAGLRDVLCAEDQTWSEVAAAVADAVTAAAERRVGSAEPRSTDVAPRKVGRVISVMGTKGGVGKSVIAINLAATLAGQGVGVVLVDLDLQSSDDGIMLKLEPRMTIRDAVSVADRLDAAMLEGFLTPHESGARVLLAPASPEETDIVTASRVASIIGLLRELADVVIIDTPSAWDETTLAAVDASDQIIAVTGMDVPSVKNTALMLTRLEQLGRGNGTVRLVLNRADSRVLLEERDVAKALGREVTARVPSDRAVPRSVNKGVPVVSDAPRSGVTRAVIDLAGKVTTNGVKR